MSATLEKGINAFKEVIDAPIASFFSSCVRCGMCAEACLFYTETNDAKYTPIYKLEPLRRVWQQEYTLLGGLGRLGADPLLLVLGRGGGVKPRRRCPAAGAGGAARPRPRSAR